jgi:hypothetical protein
VSLLFSSISELPRPLSLKTCKIIVTRLTGGLGQPASFLLHLFHPKYSELSLLINQSINRSPLSAIPHSPAHITRGEAECCMSTTALESNSPLNQVTGSQYFRKQHVLSPLLQRQFVLSSVQPSSAQLIPPYINTVCNSPARLASASTHLIPSSHPVKTQTPHAGTRIEV